MKKETKEKRIKYLQGLIQNKETMIKNYRNGTYVRLDTNFEKKAEKCVVRWKKEIQKIEESPTTVLKSKSPSASKEQQRIYREKRKKEIKYELVKEKTCTMCNKTKPASQFNKNSASKDMLTCGCKMCLNKNYGWKNNPEKQDEYYAKYGKFDTREELLQYRASKPQRDKEQREAYRNSWGSGAYLVTTTEDETYVGFSRYLRTRKEFHNSNSKRPDSCIAGIHTMKEFKILELSDDKMIEQYWIEKLKPTLNQRRAVSKKKLQKRKLTANYNKQQILINN
jgi:hypothetical protein